MSILKVLITCPGFSSKQPLQRIFKTSSLYNACTAFGSLRVLMDRLPYRQKFLNDRNSKICYHSLKDHPKVSKIAKFRCEML